LNAIEIKASFDVEGVASASALGVGSGNFGAAYRDGVLALATSGDAPSLRLAPYNSVMEALGVKIGPSRDPRGASQESQAADDKPFELDFPVQQP
jgi:hypothetical protein